MFYDGLSRLLSADYSAGADYAYGYDVAGNMVNNNGVTRTYNAANQMTNDGTNSLTYDNNGNLTNDGVNAYTWDRANRMLTAPGSTSYKYDGASNRIAQTVSGVVSAYLNDVQPGLTQLLAETVSGNTTRYVHGVRGIHATESHAGVWGYFAQDGLGSVRGIVDNMAAVVSSQSYNPIGVPATDYGKGFGFTGEQADGNDLLYLRARYYAPSKGVFTALDPFEGMQNRPMSLNGYSWVEGNPVMNVDPSGKIVQASDVAGYPSWDEDIDPFWYTCNCGWIDSNHMTSNRTATQELMINLYEAYDSESRPLAWIFPVTKSAKKFGLQFALTSELALVPDVMLRNHTMSKEDWIFRLASSMMMSITEKFEGNQGKGFSGTVGTMLQGNSSFSEEDLVSNLVGFEQAKRAGYTRLVGSQWQSIEEEVILNPNMCGAFESDRAAQYIFLWYTRGNGVETNWLMPDLPSLANCLFRDDYKDIGDCATREIQGQRRIPQELVTIVEQRIHPGEYWENVEDVVWWWLGEGNTDWLDSNEFATSP
jgi:RHS repeat-associated protein